MKSFYEMLQIIHENVEFTPNVLAAMNKKLKVMGYDVRGPQDIKNILNKGTVYRNGKFTHQDWESAYQTAVGSTEKQKQTRQTKKMLMPNVNFGILNKLGQTINPKQAGYIHPKGHLINLSGGDPYGRGLDHRIIGGYAAIQQIGAHGGYIRYMPEGGGLELRKMPTAAQLNQISRLILFHDGEINLDLHDGIGDWDERYDWHSEPERTWSNAYPEGTKPIRIINAIKQFYAGQIPAESIRDKF